MGCAAPAKFPETIALCDLFGGGGADDSPRREAALGRDTMRRSAAAAEVGAHRDAFRRGQEARALEARLAATADFLRERDPHHEHVQCALDIFDSSPPPRPVEETDSSPGNSAFPAVPPPALHAIFRCDTGPEGWTPLLRDFITKITGKRQNLS